MLQFYTGALPSHVGEVALLSGALSFVGMYAARRDPGTALLAMAMGQIASLVDSAVRPLFDSYFTGPTKEVYLCVKSVVCITAAASLLGTFGASPVALKIGAQIFINCVFAVMWSICTDKWATPYTIGA